MSDRTPPERLHGTAISLNSVGLLIIGRSGSGKSTLALELLALGGKLIADDQVECQVQNGGILMSAPKAIENRIEARGIGLLKLHTEPALLRYVVDLDVTETERLPEKRETVILGEPVRLLRRVESPAFASMLYVLLQEGIA